MTGDWREDFKEARERFKRETAGHRLTVVMDQSRYKGKRAKPYRHLHFGNPNGGGYWFDLVTWPGNLVFRGDGTSFAFARTDDMFEFFRRRNWDSEYGIDVSYCAEKLTSDRDSVVTFQEEKFLAAAREQAQHAIEQEHIQPDQVERFWAHFNEEFVESGMCGDETGAVGVLEDFEFYNDESKEFSPRHKADFTFEEWWEWFSLSKGYDWWFLWALCAIAWGIERYDATVGTKAVDVAKASDTAQQGKKATVGQQGTWGHDVARQGRVIG